MVLWDSRLLHCNVPGFHPFDEMDLQTALADVGLQEASAEPCRDGGVDSTVRFAWFCYMSMQNVTSQQVHQFGMTG
jgi:hypothetical protein